MAYKVELAHSATLHSSLIANRLRIARAECQVGQLAIWSGQSRHRPVQKDFGIEVIRVTEIDNKNDIDGLVALFMACDKVISSDNSTIHLAGALGKETHFLLPRQGD